MHVESTRLARARAFEVTPELFRKLALAAVVAVYVVVTTGAVVRLTGSGLGCDHWPRCGSTPFPEKGGHAFIEFGNRVIGAITIGFTLVAWLASRRVPRLPVRVRRLALVVFVGTAAQIPLGGLTVILRLHPLLVMSHFLLALVMLAATVVVTIEARGFEEGWSVPLVPRELRLAGIVLAVVGLALVVTGAFATAAGPHAGDSSKIDRLGVPTVSVPVHAVAGGIFGAVFVFVLGYLTARRARWRRLFLFAVGLLALLLVQMAIGETQYRTGLPWLLVLAHVAVAAALWVGIVSLATLFWRSPASMNPASGA